jgi:hypothetical protein
MSHGRLNPTSAQVDWTWMPPRCFCKWTQDAIGRVDGLTTKNFQQKGYGDLIACNCCSRQVEATRKQQHETLDSFFAGWEGKGWRRFVEFLKVTRCFRETPACFQAIQPHIISHDMSWVCMFVCLNMCSLNYSLHCPTLSIELGIDTCIHVSCVCCECLLTEESPGIRWAAACPRGSGRDLVGVLGSPQKDRAKRGRILSTGHVYR